MATELEQWRKLWEWAFAELDRLESAAMMPSEEQIKEWTATFGWTREHVLWSQERNTGHAKRNREWLESELVAFAESARKERGRVAIRPLDKLHETKAAYEGHRALWALCEAVESTHRYLGGEASIDDAARMIDQWQRIRGDYTDDVETSQRELPKIKDVINDRAALKSIAEVHYLTTGAQDLAFAAICARTGESAKSIKITYNEHRRGRIAPDAPSRRTRRTSRNPR